MPRFKSINFYQDMTEIVIFVKKIQNFQALGTLPRNSHSPPLQISGYMLATCKST